MKGARIPIAEGESARRRLLEAGALDSRFRIYERDGYLYFPLAKEVDGIESGDYLFEEREQRESFEECLNRILPPHLAGTFHTFDSIGDIAVFDCQEELFPYEREIAEAFLRTQKHFKTVLVKTGGLEGDFRTRPYRYLAGEDRTTTVHKEHGLSFALDLSKVFFSPRLATERRRVAALVSPGETVVDMFCGIGPFSLCICAHAQPGKVYAIDLNPDAIAYLQINIEKNGASECVIPLCGDARECIQELASPDRIIMNLPLYAHEFLEDAIAASKSGTFIHYYTVVEEGKEEEQRTFIQEKARMRGKEAQIHGMRHVKPYSPYTHMTVYDIRIA